MSNTIEVIGYISCEQMLYCKSSGHCDLTGIEVPIVTIQSDEDSWEADMATAYYDGDTFARNWVGDPCTRDDNFWKGEMPVSRAAIYYINTPE